MDSDEPWIKHKANSQNEQPSWRTTFASVPSAKTAPVAPTNLAAAPLPANGTTAAGTAIIVATATTTEAAATITVATKTAIVTTAGTIATTVETAIIAETATITATIVDATTAVTAIAGTETKAPAPMDLNPATTVVLATTVMVEVEIATVMTHTAPFRRRMKAAGTTPRKPPPCWRWQPRSTRSPARRSRKT